MTGQFARLVAAAAGMMLAVTAAHGQTDTTFSYQGELQEDGSPANGSFNLDFLLWDALNSGSQVGSTAALPGVPVTDGRFTVELDFGAQAFNGDPVWLEIRIDGQILSPRQPITRTPYAIQTRGIFVDADQDVGIGTTSPGARLDVVTQTANAGNNSARFSAPNLGTRTSHIHWGLTGDWFIRSADASGNVLIQDNGGNVGIGTAAPTTRLHVVTNIGGSGGAAVLGQNTLTGSISATGIRGESASNFGTGVQGVASATSGSNEGVRGTSASTSGIGTCGWATATSGTNYGVYGIAGSSTGFDFYAGGPGVDWGSSSSRRWKRNIERIDDPLYKLSKLRGVYFDWNEEHGGHHDVGFIAEEVGAVLPEIVQYEANGTDAIGMDYSKLTPLLVEAVNALREENDVLRHHNADLQSRLEALEQLMQRHGSAEKGRSRK